VPINLNGTTFNNGGVAKFINTALDSIKHGTTEVWKKMTYFFNGGTVSGYSWIDGFTPTYANMGVGSTIYSNVITRYLELQKELKGALLTLQTFLLSM